MSRRSNWLLAGLAAVALANGVLLGLSLYGLLVAAVKVIHGRVPSLGFAWIFGLGAGVAVLWRAFESERRLREGEYWSWSRPRGDFFDESLAGGFTALVEASTLTTVPALSVVETWEPNAFAVGRSRDEASVVVTTGLLELLEPAEVDAVIAHELAHIEAGGLRAIGLADGVVDSLAELSQARGRYFWGAKAIARDLRPLLGVCAAIVLLSAVHPSPQGDPVATLVLGLLTVGLLIALLRAALRSWRGLAQLLLKSAFFGPLSVIEMLLAPPTALVLSRLLSRSRIHEADRRAVELCGDATALVAALQRLASQEALAPDDRLGYLRFSLFVPLSARHGYRAWLSRIYRTHPSIASRVEAITEIATLNQQPAAPAAVGPG